jgi:NitT/TauT family transport system permease protein
MFVAGLLVVWQLGARLAGIPQYILPVPSEIFDAFSRAVGLTSVWANVRVTASEAALGFLIAAVVGLALAAFVAVVPRIEQLVMPYLIASQTVPTVALAPLLLIWFGFDEPSKLAMAALTAFFPIVINAMDGLRSTAGPRHELLQSLGASRWQILRMVRIPQSLPYIFAGLDVGVVFALLGAVVGEFSGARGPGLPGAAVELRVRRSRYVRHPPGPGPHGADRPRRGGARAAPGRVLGRDRPEP